MSDRHRPHRKPISQKKFTALASAERAIQIMALQKGTTTENIRKHIQLEMITGMVSTDPAVQAAWKRIPCAGELPTPEEVIAYYAQRVADDGQRKKT